MAPLAHLVHEHMTKQYPAVTRDDTISAVFGISGDADAARDAAGAQGIVQQSGKSGPQTFHAAVAGAI